MISATRTHQILLCLYGMVVGLSVWGMLSRAGDVGGLPIGIWTAVGAVSATGAMLEILLRMRTRQALKLVEEQIKKMADQSEVGLIMLDDHQCVGELTSILNKYLVTIRNEFDELGCQRRELDLIVAAANAEKQNTEAVIKSISDGVIVLNAFGEPILANRLVEELFGLRWSPSDMEHQPIEELIDQAEVVDLIDQARLGRREPVKEDIRITDPSGSQRHLELTVCPVYIREDTLWAIVAIFHDVTRERELAELKNDFVDHVSHELRAPLSSIKAYTQFLLEDEVKDDRERLEFYRVIAAESNRLERFVDNVLDLSRIDSGLMPMHPEQIDLADELRELAAVIQGPAQEKQIDVQVEISSDAQVWADRDLLRQAVLNLLSNAVKYTPTGGQVRLRTRKVEREDICLIEVVDTGMGISSQDKDRVFDKFYRTENVTGGVTGSGLGLALAKKIVEQLHGGTLSVESEPGKGSRFVIALAKDRPTDVRDDAEMETELAVET